MTIELSDRWAAWRDRREPTLIAEGVPPEEAADRANREAEARARLATIAGVDVALRARVVAATGPNGEAGAAVSVDLAALPAERREAVRQAVLAEARREAGQ